MTATAVSRRPCSPMCYGSEGTEKGCDCACDGLNHGKGSPGQIPAASPGGIIAGRPAVRRRRGKARQLTPEERRERREQDMQRLEDATLRLMEDGAWTSWLDARARFRKYSPHNSMLILYQKPDASAIASYNQWQEMGYQVRKGEHGIRILAPKTYERRPDRPDLQPQRDGTRPPQGTDSDEKPGLQGIYFVSVSVFDRSQVDPIPGQQHVPLEPPQPALLEGDSHAHLFEPLLEHAAKHGIEVNPHDQDLPEHARGVFRPGAVESSDPKVSLIGKGRPYIGVRADMPPNQKVNTMIHELAHAHKPQDSPFTRAEEEKIAESTSYTVARTAGLQTDGKSIPYIASWSRDRQGAEKLRALAGEIHRRASLIEAALGL